MKIFYLPDGWSRLEYEDIESIPPITQRGMGVIYCVLFGNRLKIGCSSDPVTRYKTFCHDAKYHDADLGDMFFSSFHYNFKNNERIIHERFANKRFAGTELFDIDTSEFFREIQYGITFNDSMKQNEQTAHGRTGQRSGRKQNPFAGKGAFITHKLKNQVPLNSNVLMTLTATAFAVYQLHLFGTPTYQIAELMDISSEKVNRILTRINKAIDEQENSDCN